MCYALRGFFANEVSMSGGRVVWKTGITMVMLAGLLVIGNTGSIRAAESWVRVRSPHFTVISNAGSGPARNVAWQFEQFRAAMQTAWAWARVELDRPVIVIAARDESTMRLLTPQFWENHSDVHFSSYSQPSADGHYVALRADVKALGQENVNPYRSAYWQYSWLALNAAFPRGLPYWFERGFANVLSNTIVNSSSLEFGRPIESWVTEYQRGRFDLRELLSMTRDSPAMKQPIGIARFDAQSWALVDFLLYGSPNAEQRTTRVNELAKLLLAGTSSVDAVEKVFGSLDALDGAYKLYMGQGMFRFQSIKADVQVSAKDFGEEPLSPAKSLAARAALHAAMQRPEAIAEIAEIRKADPRAPESFEIEGRLAEHDNKLVDARNAYRQAAELDSSNFYVYFRLASLARVPGADPLSPEDVEKWLLRSVALNDRFAAAWTNLANVRLQLRRPGDAVAAARKAAELQPDLPYPHLTLAQALWQMQAQQEAIDEAHRAAALARTDQERRSAEGQLAMFERMR
jgi:tetratricopeptide (TPR) repeat protein